MKRLTGFIIFLFCNVCYAQKTKPHGRFFSANSIALVRGEKGHAFSAQTINGWRKGLWAGGIGLAYDNYQRRSMPLFAQLQMPLAKTGFSLYAAGGRNILLNKADANWFAGTKEEASGRYLEAGLQYNWQLNDAHALIFNIGYSEKTYKEQQMNTIWCITEPCLEDKSTWNYSFRRIAVKAGWMF